MYTLQHSPNKRIFPVGQWEISPGFFRNVAPQEKPQKIFPTDKNPPNGKKIIRKNGF
jgi:hypothetical protein